MNERIEELSTQAFEYTLDQLNSGLEFRDFQPIWTEKFARLIVRECADVAFLEANSRKTQRAVLQHFGVEE